MHGCAYDDPGLKTWKEVPQPIVIDDTHAIGAYDTSARAAEPGALKVVVRR